MAFALAVGGGLALAAAIVALISHFNRRWRDRVAPRRRLRVIPGGRAR